MTSLLELAVNPAGVMMLLLATSAAICLVMVALRQNIPVTTTSSVPAVAVRRHLTWTTVSLEQSPTAPGHTQPRAPGPALGAMTLARLLTGSPARCTP